MARQKMYIEITGMVEILNNLTRILKVATTNVQQLPMLCALDYILLIKDRIITQHYKYPELDDDYAEWKNEHYPNSLGFWHLGGDLIRSLVAVNLGNNTWAGTIPAGVVDKGYKSYRRDSTTEILMYALVLEEGNKKFKIPPRPLFVPTALDYEKDGYQVRINKVRSEFLRSWRK